MNSLLLGASPEWREALVPHRGVLPRKPWPQARAALFSAPLVTTRGQPGARGSQRASKSFSRRSAPRTSCPQCRAREQRVRPTGFPHLRVSIKHTQSGNIIASGKGQRGPSPGLKVSRRRLRGTSSSRASRGQVGRWASGRITTRCSGLGCRRRVSSSFAARR